MVQQQHLPPPVRKALDGARGFAKAGHGFPFSFYGTADTVFWPGCGLAAHRPGLVREVRKILSRQLQKPVGLVLDCCYDPAYGLGDTETAAAALREISERLHGHGVQQVITGCLNCYKLLSQRLDGIDVVFILELLPSKLLEKREESPLYLHHPCPSARWEGIRKAARDLLNHSHESVSHHSETVPFADSSTSLCCGAGGGLCSFSPELAGRFLDRILSQRGGRTIMTYCIGCQNRFLGRGVEAIHLLECLPGVTPRRRVSSPAAQWANRFFLSMTARMDARKLLVGLIIAILIAAGVYLNRQQVFSAKMLMDLLGSHPVLAPVMFLGIYAISPSLFLPSIPLTLAAGFFWGPIWGVIFSIAGATIGACLPFFLSRYLFQDAVKARVPVERWQWLQDKVHQHGWKAVAFTRLIPVFPFNLLNYLFGLTPIPFRQYLWSTFVFMLPACVAFVAFGSSLGELLVRGNVRGVVMGVAIAAAAFSLPIALRPFFRKIGDNGAVALPDKKEKENLKRKDR